MIEDAVRIRREILGLLMRSIVCCILQGAGRTDSTFLFETERSRTCTLQTLQITLTISG